MIQFTSYNPQTVETYKLDRIEELSPLHQSSERIEWIDIEDINVRLTTPIAEYLDIHPLIMQDILNNTHLPKIELDESSIFMILKIMSWDHTKRSIHKEQISLILRPNQLITFQEEPFIDAFKEVKNRLLSKQSTINKGGIDVLFLRIISTIINDYNKIIIAIQADIDATEQQILRNHNIDISQRIVKIKAEIYLLKKYLFPTKEIIYELKTNGQNWIDKTSLVYIQDIQDHILDTISNLDTLRESIKDVMDLQASLINQQMNTIMKTLTVISVVFMPLNFIVGFYGMNIDTLPAVHWKWIMITLLGIMLIISLLMIWYMKTKKWL